mmetsp:Transcript_10219/g.21642  ORF Transcript_10219/g.21642 Transcript_10219/m.21642 type:complete len:260 (-) Transcript_10219:1008-1787(-)
MMQRRVTQRRSASSYSPSRSLDDINNKKKRRKIPPSILYVVGFFIVAVICLPLILSPSQKKEISEVEHQVEGWWLKQQFTQKSTNIPQEQQQQAINQSDKDDDDDDDDDHNKQDQSDKDDDNKQEQQQKQQQQESGKEDDETPVSDANLKRSSSDAATARMEAQSSRWVDGEKALKKKLKVLYDQQLKGKYLGVPVLTRYLGEGIPAYVGTPDSPMKEDEWKKIVESKYEEMRLEDEDWKKKVAAQIAKRGRDIGITTT